MIQVAGGRGAPSERWPTPTVSAHPSALDRVHFRCWEHVPNSKACLSAAICRFDCNPNACLAGQDLGLHHRRRSAEACSAFSLLLESTSLTVEIDFLFPITANPSLPPRNRSKNSARVPPGASSSEASPFPSLLHRDSSTETSSPPTLPTAIESARAEMARGSPSRDPEVARFRSRYLDARCPSESAGIRPLTSTRLRARRRAPRRTAAASARPEVASLHSSSSDRDRFPPRC